MEERVPVPISVLRQLCKAAGWRLSSFNELRTGTKKAKLPKSGLGQLLRRLKKAGA